MTINLKQVNLKVAQGNLPKTITWTKKLRKRRHEWERACVERGLRPQNIKTLKKTRFGSKVIMFEEVLEFKEATKFYFIYSKRFLGLRYGQL